MSAPANLGGQFADNRARLVQEHGYQECATCGDVYHPRQTECPACAHRKYAALAADPQPGVHIYRSELRPVSDDLHSATDTGRHWTTKPMDYHWGGSGYRGELPARHVVWHAVLDDPATQVEPQSNYRAFEQDEVRLRPGAQVRITGHSISTDDRGRVRVGQDPEVLQQRQLHIKIRGEASP